MVRTRSIVEFPSVSPDPTLPSLMGDRAIKLPPGVCSTSEECRGE